MRRTVMTLVALAVFAAGAHATQVAPTHRRNAAQARMAHSTQNRAGGTHRATTTQTSRRSATAGARRLTANEAGWRAGLAIRRQREHRQGAERTGYARARRAPSYHVMRVSETVRRPVRTYEPIALYDRSASTANRSEKMYEDAAASVAMNSPASNEGVSHPEQRPEPENTVALRAEQSQATEEMADNRTVPPAPRPAPYAGAQDAAPAAVAGSDADSNTDGVDQEPVPSEATSVEAETEEADLRLPRGVTSASLKGSLESLERQNSKLDAEGLERIEDEDDLAARIANKLLVPLPVSTGLTVNPDLLENHRYCRPWTARFLADLARAHEAVFHKPLEVSSAVRTVEYQRQLMRVNGNAAPAEGDVVSPHLTGATVDIAKSGLSRQEMTWMRRHLLALQNTGKIDVEEEFRQACFHITVYSDYAPERQRPLIQANQGTHKPKRQTAPPADNRSVSTAGL